MLMAYFSIQFFFEYSEAETHSQDLELELKSSDFTILCNLTPLFKGVWPGRVLWFGQWVGQILAQA